MYWKTLANARSNPAVFAAELVSAARADFAKELGGKQYHSFIPDGQKPPLD